ncbi:EpsG family protein [Sphingobacterium sp. 40-24]|uniref:EpsG family protein n=1 Tax=Sphingobacterium sp. 40-24 TaxID=1895843 RepID=UPI000960912A|nr:EpsG family protein [Sphingobacterium sp. 40-24]OJZ13216.1 MAG: hypothetical protein BGP15_16040 [Sphingobacterium sp. 40-24]
MIYLFLSIVILTLVVTYDLKKLKAGRDLWYWTIFIFFVCVAGLRYKVGGDSLEYYNSFTGQIPTLNDLSRDHFFSIRYEPFWIILNSVCKTIINDFALFQFVHAFWINFVIFKFFKNNTQFRFTAILVYWMFFYFYFNMEILRESIAISLFLVAYPYLSKKKWLKYYIIVICSAMFHTSAIFLLFLPFFSSQVLNRVTLIRIAFVVVGTVFLLGVVPSIVPGSELQQRFASYQLFTPTFTGFTYYSLIYFFGPLYLYFNYIKYRSPVFEELVVAYFTIAGVVCYLTGFARLINYFTPFLAVFFTNYVFLIYELKKYKQIRSLVIVGVFLISFIPKYLYYFQDTSDLVANTHKYDLWYPYNSIFDKQENQIREQLFYRSFNNSREYLKNKN